MAKQRPQGWWYPYIYVGAFMVVLTVNVILMYFATTTFNGLETRSAYKDGNSYNAVLAADAAQKALGWEVAFTSTADEAVAAEGRPARLELVVRDAEGHPVDGLTVSAEVRRPTKAGYDQTVRLDPYGPGTYRQTVALPLPGQWEVRLVATRGEDTYRLRDRILLR